MAITRRLPTERFKRRARRRLLRPVRAGADRQLFRGIIGNLIDSELGGTYQDLSRQFLVALETK